MWWAWQRLRCCASVVPDSNACGHSVGSSTAAAEYGLPFSKSSLEMIGNDTPQCKHQSRQQRIHQSCCGMQGGCCHGGLVPQPSLVLLCACPIIDRLERLYATAGAAFLRVGGWTLSHYVWQRCSVIEGRCLRAMMRGNNTRGKPWCESAQVATKAARAKLKRLGFHSL